MKLIKCRAWFEDEMIYSNCDIADYIFDFNPDGELCFNIWNDELHKLTPNGDVTFLGWDEYTKNIMMFTNFCDINNTEIYIGDIVKFTAFGRMVYGVVEWDIDDGLPGFVIVDTDGSGTIWSFLYDDMTVIGNIYKNPELLKLS
jgi:uncharacterized phage protein (TIGR01671 family)